MDFMNVFSRSPDSVQLQTDEGWSLMRSEGGSWRHDDIMLRFPDMVDAVGKIIVSADSSTPKRFGLRWKCLMPAALRILNDHWERGYGDLMWQGLVPERVLPWYFMAEAGGELAGVGVLVGPGAFCFWQLDPAGISLWLDVRNGGSGVRLGGRVLHAATLCLVRSRGDSFAFARSFARSMAADPMQPGRAVALPLEAPVYGGNNWYYAYGKSSADEIRQDAAFVADCAGGESNRPYMVIDDGWQLSHDSVCNGGPWLAGNYRFPDMAGLAADMKAAGVRPGLWCRPLTTIEMVPEHWWLKRSLEQHRASAWNSDIFLDPSQPEVLEHLATIMGRFASWGYELVKHDFSTWDIFGRWGFQMGAQITDEDWCFGDRGRTSAEIIRAFYASLLAGVRGKAIIIGCNTVGHLAAGLVHLQRTGDDTSGREWERTRKMGINTLAFRMPQHGNFYAVDADCVGLTSKVPFALTERWMELLAASGTPLFISVEPRACGPREQAAVRRAFATAAKDHPPAEPLDWMDTPAPSRWLYDGIVHEVDWYDPIGINFYGVGKCDSGL